jgi:hypothetical protein
VRVRVRARVRVRVRARVSVRVRVRGRARVRVEGGAEGVRGQLRAPLDLRRAVVERRHEEQRLQPYVMEAATVCDGGCNRM